MRKKTDYFIDPGTAEHRGIRAGRSVNNVRSTNNVRGARTNKRSLTVSRTLAARLSPIRMATNNSGEKDNNGL